jgi:Zn/Cd-binding protein ZinT
LEKYEATLKIIVFTEDLKQHLHHKNDNEDIYNYEKSEILTYHKGFLYISLGPT